MNIFENLENLNVSEDCFKDIINLLEDEINIQRSIRKNAKKNIKNLLKQQKENNKELATQAFQELMGSKGDSRASREKDKQISAQLAKEYKRKTNAALEVDRLSDKG